MALEKTETPTNGVIERLIDALRDLVQALTNADDKVGFIAVESLAALGPDAKPAVPLLKEAFADPKFMIRRAATNALQRIQAGFLEDSRVNLAPESVATEIKN